MWIQQIVLGILGLSAGIIVAGGLFSFIIELGILADFADRTHTGDHVLLYEDAAALGGGQTNQLLEPFLGPVGGGFFQERADGHDKSDLPGCKQIPDGDSSKHCDAD